MRTSIRMALAAWLLAMVVIVYAYTGVLTAYLTVSKLEPTVDTIEQLASSNRYRITMERSTLLSKQIMVYQHARKGNSVCFKLLI